MKFQNIFTIFLLLFSLSFQAQQDTIKIELKALKDIPKEKLQKDDEKPHVESEYASTIKKQKRDKINEENIHVIMLSQIPGISATIASAIMTEYKTIFQLEKAFKEQVHQIKELFNNKIKKFKEFNESI